MPTLDTVAMLNQMGGKSPAARNTRFQARVSGIFSPVKDQTTEPNVAETTRRSSGRLQKKRVSKSGPSTARRNSFSLPDDHEMDSALAPKPKKTTTLRKNKKDDQSPLKKHGYDLELQDNPGVNLADSPAKNTRSRYHNPLETLANANLPKPRTSQAAKKSKSNPSPDAAVQATPSKRKAVESTETEGRHPTDTRSAKRARVAEVPEALQSRQEEHSNTQQEEQTQADNVPVQKKRGRPHKAAGDGQGQSTKSTQKDAAAQIQREKAIAQELAEFDKKRKRFAKDIGNAIQINNCTDVWMNLGAAAYMIQRASVQKATSTPGGAAQHSLRDLMGVYRAIKEPPHTSPEQERSIEECMEKIEDCYDLLVPADNRQVDSHIVKDIYLIIIPESVILLKAFLRGRCHQQFFDEEVLRELAYLLDLSMRICTRARSWKPQPSTLDYGIKRWVKNDILANLKKLVISLKPELERYDRIRDDREAISRLAKKQEIARETQKQRIESLRTMRAKLRRGDRHIQKPQQPQPQVQDHDHDPIEKEVYDVDEIENYLFATATPVDELSEADVESLEPRPQLLRESTDDLPPPLSINLSEEEKMALLNGLQRYTGDDRYNDIYNDRELGSILKKRDLDDLMKAAISFSQMMASKMGIDAYRANTSLWWLRSTDPDARDGESVVL